MASFNLSVVAPDRTVVEQPVTSVIAPGALGYLGVLAGHAPMIVALKTGLLEYRDLDGQRNYVAVGGGFMEVSGTNVIVLADNAERAEEIDVEREEELLRQARAALRGEASEMSSEDAAEEIELALNRLRAARTV